MSEIRGLPALEGLPASGVDAPGEIGSAFHRVSISQAKQIWGIIYLRLFRFKVLPRLYR